MKKVRNEIGGVGNLLFKEAYLWGQFRDGKIPDFYVQSSKYWEKYKEEIRTRFSHGIGYTNKVALHIRRGDYLKVSQFHSNLWDTDYYKEAIKLFPKDAEFLVFCKDNQSEEQDADDRAWCLDNMPFLLGGRKWEMYDHTTETDDLNAMASCESIIGCNSSFSWWAAFLGNPHKKVVMPKEERWFTDKKTRCELLEEWTKI